MASPTGFALTVRFAASLPDQALSVPDPYHTSILTLIGRIRERLPDTHSSLRVRLIHAGRVLSQESSVATALRLPSHTTHASHHASEKAKGKAPVRPPPPLPQNVYIHATFSDALTAAALQTEKDEALAFDVALQPPSETAPGSPERGVSLSGSSGQATKQHGRHGRRGTDASIGATLSRTDTSASQMPQGFDRLLSAGLSPLEVASLRSQFVAILAHTHTPDTMPGAAELRQLEERWLDNDTEGNGLRGASGAGATGVPAGMGDEDTGGLEDMLWGNIMGFFWPIGAVVWLLREEGVWTQRRRVAVVTGALVNLAFSVMRAAS